MVKARIGNKVYLGITDGNVDKLRDGMPIYIDMADLGYPDVELMIFHGKDEVALYKTVEPMIGKDTKVHISDKMRGSNNGKAEGDK